MLGVTVDWHSRSSNVNRQALAALLPLFSAALHNVHPCQFTRQQTLYCVNKSSSCRLSRLQCPAVQMILKAADCTASCRLLAHLVKKQGIRPSQERRWEAVNLWNHHQHWSFSVVAKKMKCRHAFVSRWVRSYQQLGHVNDQLRSGRPPKADAAAVQHILMVAQLPDCNTADAIAAKTEQDLKLSLSRSTVKRLLKGQGLPKSNLPQQP